MKLLEPGGKKFAEYSLDSPKLSENSAELKPWLRHFCGLSTDQAREKLRERWKNLQFESSTRLANEYIENFRPVSVIVTRYRQFLVIERPLTPDYTGRLPRDVALIPTPAVDSTVVKQHIANELPAPLQPEVTEFMVAFGGVNDRLEPDANEGFAQLDRWYSGDEEDSSGFIELYLPGSGCYLITPEGTVEYGQWEDGVDQRTHIGQDLLAFVKYYVQHRKPAGLGLP